AAARTPAPAPRSLPGTIVFTPAAAGPTLLPAYSCIMSAGGIGYAVSVLPARRNESPRLARDRRRRGHPAPAPMRKLRPTLYDLRALGGNAAVGREEGRAA